MKPVPEFPWPLAQKAKATETLRTSVGSIESLRPGSQMKISELSDPSPDLRHRAQPDAAGRRPHRPQPAVADGIRELPDVNPPVVSVETRYRGASPQIIETKITQPIEDRIAGIEQHRQAALLERRTSARRSRWSSTSTATSTRPRTTSAIASAAWSTHLCRSEADPPEISKADANAEPIIFVNLSSDTLGSLELTDYAERYVVDRFAALPGVARVRLTGAGATPCASGSIARRSPPARSPSADIESALRRRTCRFPPGASNRSSASSRSTRRPASKSPDDFRNLIIGRGAGWLSRQARRTSRTCSSPRRTSARIARTNRIPGVNVGIEAQANANALEVAQGRARRRSRRSTRICRRARELGINIDRAVFIEASLHEVLIALAISFIARAAR